MVYFIQAIDGGPIKIGTTKYLIQRLKQIDAERGAEHHVLGVMPGSYSEEKAVHQRFAHLCREGEWFEEADELLSAIGEIAEPWNGVDDVSPKTVVAVKGSEEFGDWLDRAASFVRQPSRANLVRIALEDFAKASGFEPPPRR